VPTREQVRRLLDSGLDYQAAGRELGIPPGQAYLIATGVPADGSGTITDEEAGRPGFLPSSQHLANPPHENPTTKESVAAWLKARVGSDEQMRTALRERTAEPPEIDPETERESHDAVTVLGRQHNQVDYLLKQLQALPSHTTGGSAEQMSARKSVVDMITVRLAGHETIEEEHFWPLVRKALPDGDQYADQALGQEQAGKDTLTELGRLDPATREFDELVEQLVAQLREHVAFEDMVFLKVREAVPREELDQLGEKLLSAMKTAPTRPHKHAPKRRGAAVKAAAPGAAALDKARDAAGDRPAKRKGQPRQQSEGRPDENQQDDESQGGAG
jgi:hemerythrin HHE cation binding domain-containing protein